MLRRLSWALCLLTAVSVLPAGAAPASGGVGETVEYRFTVATRGPVGADVEEFAGTVGRVLNDGRGWALDGRVRFPRVESGGDFTVWLAAASAMRSFGPPCHPMYSCRSGRNVIINEDRWTSGSEPWAGPLEEYRTMVVNHETGHWLGFGHASCDGSGQPAPVMMQQSKGTGACAPNPWPLPSEREAFARRLRAAPARAPDTVAVVGVTSRPSGWWTVATDGTVAPDGLGHAPTRSAVGIVATSAGGGYWVAAADGGVFAFGDAPFLGRPEGPLNQPVVGMAATPSGQGYWLAAADGGVFGFGDAAFFGRPASSNEPVVGMAATPSGQGYWLAAADGGVFAFGDAVFHGPGFPDTVAIASTPQGTYRLATADGTVVTYG
jgi:hypothetical protein